jgi:nucleoside-diphosphate-sugar epimerase
MKHVIIGYGYTGMYLARQLVEQKHKIWTISRTLVDAMKVDGVTHLIQNACLGTVLDCEVDIVHYMIPPPRGGRTDSFLSEWLENNLIKTRKIIYYGSSGVYGDQSGELTDENATCNLQFDRQYQRLNAEEQLLSYGEEQNIVIGILRIAGIIGPDRIPNKRIINRESVIRVSQAPWSNTIFIYDLVNIALLVARKLRKNNIFNVSDGIANPMGSTHRLLSIIMGINTVFEESFEDILLKASPIKKEFLLSSKKLSIDKLKNFLGDDLVLTEKIEALKISLAESTTTDEVYL